MSKVVGLDVGGAHLKAAVAIAGKLQSAAQFACPLWQGLGELDKAFTAAHGLMTGADIYAVTMTGELCELFASRRGGVAAIVSHVGQLLGSKARFFMGLKGFGNAAAALSDPESVASANFLATARAISERQPKTLLIDFGSTTTDIIVCDRPHGLTDAERLQTGELVYTGFTRTPVPSITTRAPLLGTWQGLARDPFATMADVRRILGKLPEGRDQHTTADGRGTSIEESLARFARGFGRDGDMRHLKGWQAAAAYICDVQLSSIYEGAIQVLSRPGTEVTNVVTAGIGTDSAADIAQRLGLKAVPFGELIETSGTTALAATYYAPAAALSLLK